jgi:hypothetical protein
MRRNYIALRTRTQLAVLIFGAVVAAVCLIVMSRTPKPSVQPEPVEQPMSVDEAKRVISEFAASAKCVWLEGISRPQLPEVTPDVGRALQSLEGNVDSDSLADIAAILVRFAIENERCCGFGTPMNPDDPLTRAFMSATNAELPGDEIISTCIAEWVCAHRGELGKSQTLDEEIEGFQAAVQEQSHR